MPELKFKEKTTYPSDQSGAQFTKVFEIKGTNPRIKFAANEEIIDGISWKEKVLTQTVRQLGGLQRALLSAVRGPRPAHPGVAGGSAGGCAREDRP